MKTMPFGWTGVPVPIVGQGTWQMERDDRSAAIAALRRGLDAGMTHIDTAELYGSGRVEEMVAEAIEGRRDEVFLVSKVMPQNASRRGTVQACDRSLKRLQTDRIDLYLLHWPGSHRLEDTIAAFDELVQAGKIRYWGVSNFDVRDLERALAIAGERAIACNQVLYHLLERSIEHAVLPWCEAHDVALMGYSPFGSGNFPRAASAGGRVLSSIANAHSASARQVALSYLVRKPALFTIPKSAHADRVIENAAAADLKLTEQEIEQIDRAFARGPDRGLPTI